MIDEELDRFTGKLGALSAKTGWKKVTSDYTNSDLMNECIIDDDQVVDDILNGVAENTVTVSRGSRRDKE